jgi:hypothetical protein
MKRLSLKEVRLELKSRLESFESDFRKDTVVAANLDDWTIIMLDAY